MKKYLSLVGYLGVIQLFCTASGFASVTWTSNPITLPDAQANVAYTQSVAQYAKSSSGSPLTFNLVGAGSSWLTITPDGVLSGTPAMADVGPNTFRLTAADSDGAGAITMAHINVTSNNPPPPPQPAVATCADGSPAYLVGPTHDKKFDVFTCRH